MQVCKLQGSVNAWHQGRRAGRSDLCVWKASGAARTLHHQDLQQLVLYAAVAYLLGCVWRTDKPGSCCPKCLHVVSECALYRLLFSVQFGTHSEPDLWIDDLQLSLVL